jgi:hypothetical protein
MQSIEGYFTIEKTKGKGAWSFVILPNLFDKTNNPFGWKIIKGKIDDYEISQYKAWPNKHGELFLPIKSEIRKKIKKEEGDSVFVKVFADDSPLEIPEEFLVCLNDEPQAKAFFEKLSDTSKKQYIDRIYEAKQLKTRVTRIAKTIEKLSLGLKYHEKID